MKRLICVVCALGFVCSACVRSKSDANKGVAPTGSVAVADAVTGTAQDQSAYLYGVRASAKASYTDKELILFGDLACDWLAEGADAWWTANALRDEVTAVDGKVDDIPTIMAAAVVNLCPGNLDKVKNAK